MQRDPQRRYATADALAQDIERYLQGETVSARPDSVAYRMHKALKRHWVGVSAVTAVLIAVLSGSAVALVQAQRAARASERERMVREFVADVFRINARVNPVNAAMRPASPVSLLEGGAQLIQQRFAGQPDMQAELFAVVGGVFSDMGAYKLAADYSTHRIEALNLSHADNLEQARALLTLAQALFDNHKYADAEVRLRKVLDMSKDELPLRLDALVLLTRLQLGLEHLKEAQAAQQALETQVKGGSASPIVKAWSVFLQASILERQNHFEQTLPLYQQAIDQAQIAEGPLSTTAISMRLPAAFRIMQHANYKLARQYFDEAEKALRQLGGAHEVRASFEAAEFTTNLFSYASITPSEAIDQISHDRALLAASNLPIPEWYFPYLDRNIAFIKMTSGDVTTGIPLFELSESLLRKSLGPDPEHRETALAFGVAMMVSGRHDMADKLLREALELAIAAGQGLHPYSAIEYAYIAENLRMAGKFEEDKRFLDTVPHFEALRGNETSTDTYNNMLTYERASLLLDTGDGKGAIQLLKTSPPEETDEQRIAYYQGMVGQAHCLNHQGANGLPLQKKALAFAVEKGNLNPGHPDFGYGWAEVGLCAFEMGDKAAALNYAAKARKVFAIQPGVSPYYKKPLQKLERLLGNQATTSKS
jgi:serine/threonine-protein kinase